jgi:hypothetical protein
MDLQRGVERPRVAEPARPHGTGYGHLGAVRAVRMSRMSWPAGAGDGAGDGRLLDGVSGAVLEPDESAYGIRWMGLGRCWRPDARSAVKY